MKRKPPPQGAAPPPQGTAPPPHYSTNPTAPPDYTQHLPGGERKGIDWSLNTRNNGNHDNTSRYHDNTSRYHDNTRPGPSAPHFSPRSGEAGGTKGIDWSLNRPPPHESQHPVYPGAGQHPSYPQDAVRGVYPAIPNTAIPDNPYTRWKTQFSRYYPGARMSRDNPSVIKVEIPKNRAYPVVGHANCPECFDSGPHQTTVIKRKESFLSTKKLPAQKCRKCYKLAYFVQSSTTVPEEPRVDRPPPYLNQPSRPEFNTHAQSSLGHGWSESEHGHGWDPGEGDGHGWGR